MVFRRAGPPALFAFALILLTATHWPGVSIHGPVARSDLWVHAAAYLGLGLLTLAVLAARGPLSRPRLRWICLALFAFAAADELTQPWFGRTADASDWFADAVGIMLAGVLGQVTSGICRRNPRVQGASDTRSGTSPQGSGSSKPDSFARTNAATDEPAPGPRPTDARVRA